MVTRIRPLKVQLGALLLLVMLQDPSAFTLNTPVRSSFLATPPTSHTLLHHSNCAWSGDSEGTTTCLPTTNIREGVQRFWKKRMEKLGRQTSTSYQQRLVPWTCVILLALPTLLPTRGLRSSWAGSKQSNVILAALSSIVFRFVPGNLSWHSTAQPAIVFTLLATTNGGMNLLQWLQVAGVSLSTWYMSCLSTFPLSTNALTTATLGLIGDTGAQILEERIRAKKEGTQFDIQKHYDGRRGLANIADGIFVTGPLMYVAYELLEAALPIAAASGWAATRAALAHVFLDGLVLDAVFVAIMLITTGLGEGYSMRQLLPQFKSDYVGAVKTSWATSFALMPLEFVCFRFLPVSFRVLGMNLIDIAWEGVVSFTIHRRRKGVLVEAPGAGLVEPLHAD